MTLRRIARVDIGRREKGSVTLTPAMLARRRAGIAVLIPISPAR
jgi:hypothetical protein